MGLLMNSLKEAVISVVLDSLNETKRANKDKLAGAMRRKADYIERGDEFQAARNLRDLAKGREAGPKGGTGKDSPEAKAKRKARADMQSTQRSPEDASKESQLIRKPDPKHPEHDWHKKVRSSRLGILKAAKRRKEGKKRFRSTDDGFDAWRDKKATDGEY
jgi:hypothetical protein